MNATLKIALSLPRQLLGFGFVLLSYVFASAAMWVGYGGAYLMDNEDYWKKHDKAVKEKLAEIRIKPGNKYFGG